MRRITGDRAGSDIKELGRGVRFSRKRPDPPREVRLVDGKLTWLRPRNIENVTHYKIYLEDEVTLIRVVPVGQTELNDNLAAPNVYVSSWSEPLLIESERVALGRGLGGRLLICIFNIAAPNVGVDAAPRLIVPRRVLEGGAAVPSEAYIQAVTPDTTDDCEVDIEWSSDPGDDPPGRTWTSIWPDGEKLILPATFDCILAPREGFVVPSVRLPELTNLRVNVVAAAAAILTVTLILEVQ
jgi:hypothetical protein